MRLIPLAAAALALSLSFGSDARADLVIQGRAAQALQCSAMLFMVSDELYRAGYITRNERDWAQGAAVQMLAYVPGTQDQKVQAMKQRFDKLMRRTTMSSLMTQYNDTAKWCQKNFL
ncbi:MAG: hypothetical protein R3D63_07510 [Paracoccaceae bacterium]